MSRGTWNCQKKVSGSWQSDGVIFRPNDTYTLSKSSTQSTVQLVDGSNAYITPSTKYLDGAITFVWFYEDGTTKTKVEDYIDNQDDVKITDDLGNNFIGRFTIIDSTRSVGISEERYDIRAVFERMPSLA